VVTGPHVGPQRSYVPWLAVTAGWGGTVFAVGAASHWPTPCESKGPFVGPRVPVSDRQEERALGGGMSRKKWGGTAGGGARQ
jgi:hypothetical protein